MASMQKYKTKSGKTKYRVMWRDAGRQKSKSFDKHVLAKNYLISIENGKRSGTYVAPTKLTVSQYLDTWLNIHKQRIEYNTFVGYRINVNHIKKHIGSIPIQELNGDHLELMYKDLSKHLAPPSVNYVHRVINTALKAAVKKRVIIVNPCDTIIAPSRESDFEATVIEPNMIGTYLKLFTDTWIYPALVISVVCGLRRGELSALKWSNVNLNTGELHVTAASYVENNELKQKPPKSGKPLKVYMPSSLCLLLKEHKKKQHKNKLRLGSIYHNSDYVITFENGKRPKPDRFTKFYSKRLKKSNLPYVRLHDLRGTMASLTSYEGFEDEVASAALGHHNPNFTRKHYIKKYDQELIETAQKLDKYIADLI
jgi:integrase